MSLPYKIVLIFAFLLGSQWTHAQYDLNVYDGGQLQLNSYNDLKFGKTEERQISVQFRRNYGITAPSKWKITVRLLDDYRAENYSIPAENSTISTNRQSGNFNQLAFSSIGRNLPLSKFQESTIVESTTALPEGNYYTLSFDLTIRGGVEVLTIPNGIYRSTYEFSLYDTSSGRDVLLARKTSAPGVARFQINYVGNHGDQLAELRNGANEFIFNFDSPEDIAKGKKITINNALYIRSYQGHQVLVKTADNLLYNTTLTNSIPVSVLKLKATLNRIEGGSASDVSLFGPISLSAQEQALASFPRWSQSMSYNLELSIPPNTRELQQANGRYETYLYFIIVPN
ncbi:hypothetical protein HX004_03755 [Myroides sp. 1354]|uniref:hypothetical protein n=1 Tax=unclassified Myroides TaxID=2642485 RepID=UPI00257850F9|nr:MULTISPECIES: hypothetical protein [unclassified Myroides]MDM1043959.1 hypothetical protein [Myroides sp. R163-1]MDM1054894.1 hypothetical protein [Myroides sp. 1354]MDM1068191.1 hypothetical protein [Myroides sp. 1372]